jgi:hypothetical protein
MSTTRRLAAILAGDVAGYSRLIGVDEEGTFARLGSKLNKISGFGNHLGSGRDPTIPNASQSGETSSVAQKKRNPIGTRIATEHPIRAIPRVAKATASGPYSIERAIPKPCEVNPRVNPQILGSRTLVHLSSKGVMTVPRIPVVNTPTSVSGMVSGTIPPILSATASAIGAVTGYQRNLHRPRQPEQ